MESILQLSFQLAFVSFLIFLWMLFLSSPYSNYVNIKNGSVTLSKLQFNSFFIFYALYIIFAFNSSDFYSYWFVFESEGRYVSFDMQYFEAIYNWLASIVKNYILWRIIIWGTGIYLYYLIARKLNLQNKLLLLAIVFFGFLGRYTRGMLGNIMLLLGVSLLIDKNNKVFTQILGLILFCLSYYFHKSMFVNIMFAVIAFYPFGKKSIKCSLLMFPLGVVLVIALLDGILAGSVDVLSLSDGVGGVKGGIGYVSDRRAEVNLFGIIGRVINYLPEYLSIIYLTNRIVYRGYFKGIKQERVFNYLFRLTFVSIYVASLFFFTDSSYWLYIRFKYMAFFPLPFVLAKVWSLESYSNRWVKWIIALQVFSLFFSWFVSMLNWYEM